MTSSSKSDKKRQLRNYIFDFGTVRVKKLLKNVFVSCLLFRALRKTQTLWQGAQNNCQMCGFKTMIFTCEILSVIVPDVARRTLSVCVEPSVTSQTHFVSRATLLCSDCKVANNLMFSEFSLSVTIVSSSILSRCISSWRLHPQTDWWFATRSLRSHSCWSSNIAAFISEEKQLGVC